MPHQFESSQSVKALRTAVRAERSETDSTQCCPEGGEAINVVVRGANSREITISNTLHVVTVSIPRCERGGAGATPAVGTISSSCARQRAEPAVCNTALPSASLGRTSTFHRIRESQQHSLALEARVARGSTGVSDHFYWSVA